MSLETRWLDPRQLLNESRLDLIIKRRLFLHFLSSDDPDAERIYLDHIKRRAGAHYPLGTYLPAARALFRSMQAKGFDPKSPVPVNRNNIILDGAHRTSCALALGKEIFAAVFDQDFRWPPWGREWFLGNGMANELPWIEETYSKLKG